MFNVVNLIQAVQRLERLPNVENRVGPWNDVNIAIKDVLIEIRKLNPKITEVLKMMEKTQ